MGIESWLEEDKTSFCEHWVVGLRETALSSAGLPFHADPLGKNAAVSWGKMRLRWQAGSQVKAVERQILQSYRWGFPSRAEHHLSSLLQQQDRIPWAFPSLSLRETQLQHQQGQEWNEFWIWNGFSKGQGSALGVLCLCGFFSSFEPTAGVRGAVGSLNSMCWAE